MNKDKIDGLIANLQNDFDYEMPESGHEQRFLEKLKSHNIQKTGQNRKTIYYKSFMAIAASIILCFGLFLFLQGKSETTGLASVSNELSKTQDFFTTAITSELNKIKSERRPENEVLVSDALKQLNLLEKNYERLKLDLKESGQDQRVVYAMISNFQSRIDILENVLKSIEELKQFKQSEQTQMIF